MTTRMPLRHPDIRKSLATGEFSKDSEELPHMSADLPWIMTTRALVRQCPQPVQPVLRPVPTQLAPSTPTSLSASTLREGCLTTHPDPVGRTVGGAKPTSGLTGTRI